MIADYQIVLEKESQKASLGVVKKNEKVYRTYGTVSKRTIYTLLES